MMGKKKALLILLALIVSRSLFATLELGTPFSDHVVLQRGMKVPVWGKVRSDQHASLSSRVTVSFAGQCKTTCADPVTGQWRVELDPLEASKEGRTLTVTETTGPKIFDFLTPAVDTVEIHDVLVGEVWFASGQSNMECPIWGRDARYRDEMGALHVQMTRLPHVRYCKIARKWSVEPTVYKSNWRPLLPENVSQDPFSAVAFYYARELFLALDLPIGVIDASWGGSNIDPWTPRCGYADCDPSIAATANYSVRSSKAKPAKGPTFALYQQPTVMFNGMVAAWTPMAMRGFIWYQGCSNAKESSRYTAKMHALYNGWSRAFENPQLKLYFVQLAPYYQGFFALAQAQAQFAREEPNAAMVTTADIGNPADIHPNRKEPVAKRLALHALKRDYAFPIAEDSPPQLKSVTFEGNQAHLTFDHVTSWYVYAPNRSWNTPFALAGTNGVWYAAGIRNFEKNQPFVKGPTLIVASKSVPAPVKVRYLWKNDKAGTLFNEVCLPLGPFEAK